MKSFTKLVCVAVLSALIAPMWKTAVLAAPSKTYFMDAAFNHKEVEELAGDIGEKYGISIVYPDADSQPLSAIFPQMLETLDAALDSVTPEVVRQVSSYYYKKNGRRLTFAYTSADLRGPYGLSYAHDVMVGCFDDHTSRIELYIPSHQGQAVATGDNPLTILHEFAHSLHFMLTEETGYKKMEREWKALMNNAAYNQSPTDSKTFITEYASVSYDEDFAETFSHVYSRNRPGLGFSHLLYDESGGLSPLGKKVACIERLIEKRFPDAGESLENYRKVYDTPASVNKLGMKLSGVHLSFIGMAEPRTVPLMLLNNLPIQERNTVWLSDVGGWYCQDASGNHLILFPNGTYGNPGKNILEEAIRQREKRILELEKLSQNKAA